MECCKYGPWFVKRNSDSALFQKKNLLKNVIKSGNQRLQNFIAFNVRLFVLQFSIENAKIRAIKFWLRIVDEKKHKMELLIPGRGLYFSFLF